MPAAIGRARDFSPRQGLSHILLFDGVLDLMFSLRERGIYLAPDGTRLVASRCRQRLIFNSNAPAARALNNDDNNARFYLYNSYAWSFHGPADFQVLDCGCIKPTTSGPVLPWNANDLCDTEWTAGAH
ncbi:MAG: hypothetical protein ACR2GW_10990 [Pyrinomonadaceae bacterium]|nr:hypothetical protein [Acidobacteriota bacterium]